VETISERKDVYLQTAERKSMLTNRCWGVVRVKIIAAHILGSETGTALHADRRPLPATNTFL
jgi:hypothetical protein